MNNEDVIKDNALISKALYVKDVELERRYLELEHYHAILNRLENMLENKRIKLQEKFNLLARKEAQLKLKYGKNKFYDVG